MSILGNILGKVFGRKVDADEARAEGRAQAQAQARPQATTPGATGGYPSAAGAQPAGRPAQQTVDVEALLTRLDAEKPGQSNWRTSIVDLMKLLDLDASLENRKELARELGYTGDTSDSATMNIWLHRQVMTKLAQNGGVVPASMRD